MTHTEHTNLNDENGLGRSCIVYKVRSNSSWPGRKKGEHTKRINHSILAPFCTLWPSTITPRLLDKAKFDSTSSWWVDVTSFLDMDSMLVAHFKPGIGIFPATKLIKRTKSKLWTVPKLNLRMTLYGTELKEFEYKYIILNTRCLDITIFSA
jgi:hypothetical protein